MTRFPNLSCDKTKRVCFVKLGVFLNNAIPNVVMASAMALDFPFKTLCRKVWHMAKYLSVAMIKTMCTEQSRQHR